MNRRRWRSLIITTSVTMTLIARSHSAWADDEPNADTHSSSSSPSVAPAATPSPVPVAKGLPTPSAPPAFSVDPVGDSAVIAVSTGFAGLLDLIMTTGEIRPQQISPTFDNKQLLSIDRAALTQHVDSNAGTFSNLGLAVALGYAVIDPIATGFRDDSAKTALVDGVLYAETLTITLAVTNLAKVAVRRPRPRAYTAAQLHKDDPTYSNTDTDSTLSFFSGHTATTGALGATATYLAFARSPNSIRPWVTLFASTALTTLVGYERVRAGKHFPTDVIAGAMAGTGVGLLGVFGLRGRTGRGRVGRNQLRRDGLRPHNGRGGRRCRIRTLSRHARRRARRSIHFSGRRSRRRYYLRGGCVRATGDASCSRDLGSARESIPPGLRLGCM
jgi:undecaprenyl-diphosphatase